MAKQLLVSIYSEGTPMSGQKNRSSKNFQFPSLPSPTLEWDVSGNDTPGLQFNVMQDVVMGTDPTVETGLTSGAQTPVGKLKTGTNYYISNPANTGDAGFTVNIYAVLS